MTLLSSLRLTTRIASVCVATFLVCSQALAAPPQSSDEEDLGVGSQGYTGTRYLVSGELDFTITAPGFDPMEFRSLAYELSGYPGSLIVPETPFGAAGLLLSTQPSAADYYLGFAAIGNATPLSYDAGRVVFQGDLGTAHIEVTQVPVFVWEPGDTLTQQQQQGPPAPTLHVFTYGAGLPPGVNGVCITSKNNGDVIYVQFATLKITWKGTNAAGAPVEGGCPGPITGTSANGGANGGPVKPDGGTTYVDTNTPGNGDYPNQGPGPGANERSMIDVPNVKNSAGLKNVIQAANPGVTINEITIHMNITTYVIVVTPTGRRVVKKIKWTYTETLRAPWGPDPGNGQFGGPAQGPPPPGSQFTNGQPTVEDVNAMDPNHAAALGSFQTVPATPANYTGAPANGGY